MKSKCTWQGGGGEGGPQLGSECLCDVMFEWP